MKRGFVLVQAVSKCGPKKVNTLCFVFQCLAHLVSNVPYNRLRPGLLSSLWKQIRPYVRHRGTIISCTIKTVQMLNTWSKKKGSNNSANLIIHHFVSSSLGRCERPCVQSHPLRCISLNTSPPPRDPAPPPAARVYICAQHPRQQHPAGALSQLETSRSERRRGLVSWRRS